VSTKTKIPYQKYLESIHAKNTSLEDLVSKIVKEGTGQTISSKKKIVAGEANEV